MIKKLFLIFILLFSVSVFAEIIGFNSIRGIVHYSGKDRMIITMPSGEETREIRVHIDKKVIPKEERNKKKNEKISFKTTEEMFKFGNMVILPWTVKKKKRRRM
ncbi:MAG: hypothetical protein CME70_03140 [Halobacteriovorax sp.]|nr:hypothetical protein [Halobacteriovorax sp.]MBK22978.1 hypothetical protein [Halobacteriovorax sp.]|tara:strand:- start:15770 stop:16081 length:312 start_codon:yes stop_codon:yes gene_type:complete